MKEQLIASISLISGKRIPVICVIELIFHSIWSKVTSQFHELVVVFVWERVVESLVGEHFIRLVICVLTLVQKS